MNKYNIHNLYNGFAKMKQILLIIILILVILLFAIIRKWDTIKTNIILYLTVKRGIVAPNCFYAHLSDVIGDGTGVNIYNRLKKKHGKIVKMNAYGTKLNIVSDIDFIKQILDNSPEIFGVGKLKYDFFKSFMAKNVGVSQGCPLRHTSLRREATTLRLGCPWKRRRLFNEIVLDTGKLHEFANYFHHSIQNLLCLGERGAPQDASRPRVASLPTNFKEFQEMGKRITMKIVFNEREIFEPLFDILEQANSFQPILFGDVQIKPRTRDEYNKYLLKHIRNPKEHSLLSLVPEAERDSDLSVGEIIDQIPHWIFPVNGLVINIAPRLLILLFNHPEVLQKVVQSIDVGRIHSAEYVHNLKYLRNCILESLRLNNPVNSTFRTLLQDYNFGNDSNGGDEHRFKKGDQFLILNNPVMRNRMYFRDANQFIPERWDFDGNRDVPDLEHSKYALMFNYGPQECPGKDLAIFLLQSFTVNYLKCSGILTTPTKITFKPKLDTENIPQMINSCKIKIEVV